MGVGRWVKGLCCWVGAGACFLASCRNSPDTPQPQTADSLHPAPVAYASPIDFPILLAGNFGEPRPGHFHGGLDIKTEGVEGKNIRSIADGYVSRLTVNHYGFGNAIYVAHPDGHTSVYCHLKRFADAYEALLSRTGKGDTISLDLPAGQYPVRQGDLIAFSGNTGHSSGPHLHLEMHDTETWTLLDPMSFVGSFIADTIPPLAHSFMAIPMGAEGMFCGDTLKRTFSFAVDTVACRQTVVLDRHFTAWGRVGFALWADDHAQGTHNYYGIRHTRLLVDGREVFRSDVDGLPADRQSSVGEWAMVDYWQQHRRWYMRSFVPNRAQWLPMLHADASRGIVCFDEERPYAITYILSDYYGNWAQYEFTVHGVYDARVKPVKLTKRLNIFNYYE